MYFFIKRIFDFSASLFAIVLLSPFLIVISLLVLITSGYPIFYLQDRVGKNWEMFKIFKYRTMVRNADKIGPSITPGRDNRVTTVGRFLRKYKLDELPQFFNVLLGSMSLVGPRPEVMRYAEIYKEDYNQVVSIKPGITDYSSIKFRNEADILDKVENQEEYYIKEILPERIRLSCQYINEISFVTDVKILLKTFFTIIN